MFKNPIFWVRHILKSGSEKNIKDRIASKKLPCISILSFPNQNLKREMIDNAKCKMQMQKNIIGEIILNAKV